MIGYDIKSSKGIEWSKWDHLPLVYQEIDSRNEMQLNPYQGIINI